MEKYVHENGMRGFTLIEMIIAIGLFSIFMVILTGVFSRFVEVQRHGIAQGALILDVQSAVESFAKEARTGFGSTYDVYSSGSVRQVMFRNQERVCVSYRITQSGIFERGEAPEDSVANCPIGKFSNVRFAPITSTSTFISDVLFDVTPSVQVGQTNSIENQGVITLTMTISPVRSDVRPMTIQHTVTSRQMLAYVKR